MLGLSRRYHDRYPRLQMGRGRHAETPSDIPERGWKDILWRVWEEQSADNISIVAAGVAFYSLTSLFPAIAAGVSIYGLVADPASVESQFDQLKDFLPGDALSILRDQAHSVAAASGGGLSIGIVVGLLLTLYSASRGVNALVTALNIAYEEKERRGIIRLTLLSVALTVGGILFLFLTLALVVAVPAILNVLPLGPLRWVVALVRWPILALAIMAALAVLYRYAPCRDEPKWRWVSWGSAAATVLWMIGSIGFSLYVTYFGSYNQTYGSVGAVVILLAWLQLTAYAIVLGAELNSEMEHQTARDTTEGAPRPMGQRNAHMADTVGRKRA